MPARLCRRGALGVGRLIGGEPSSEIDRRVLGSIGSGVAKGLWGHATTAMSKGVGKDLGIPPRGVALVIAATGAVVLEVKENVGATKGRRWCRMRHTIRTRRDPRRGGEDHGPAMLIAHTAHARDGTRGSVRDGLRTSGRRRRVVVGGAFRSYRN